MESCETRLYGIKVQYRGRGAFAIIPHSPVANGMYSDTAVVILLLWRSEEPRRGVAIAVEATAFGQPLALGPTAVICLSTPFKRNSRGV
jgi:hypothetical protein